MASLAMFRKKVDSGQEAPASRVLRCKVCQRYTAHVYIGRQEFPGKAFHLYNCTHCQDTTTVKV